MPYRKVMMRPFRTEEEGMLFAVAKLAFAECDDERTLETLTRDTVFVAELAGETAGYVAIEDNFEWAEGYAIANGAGRLEVVVERGNDRAESFYRGRGFVPAGPDLLELVLPQGQ